MTDNNGEVQGDKYECYLNQGNWQNGGEGVMDNGYYNDTNTGEYEYPYNSEYMPYTQNEYPITEQANYDYNIEQKEQGKDTNKQPLYYIKPMHNPMDEVRAVSHMMFGDVNTFSCIPLHKGKQNVRIFRKRRKQDTPSEWSNAFATHSDICACVEKENTYDKYNVSKYRNKEGAVVSSMQFY